MTNLKINLISNKVNMIKQIYSKIINNLKEQIMRKMKKKSIMKKRKIKIQRINNKMRKYLKKMKICKKKLIIWKNN